MTERDEQALRAALEQLDPDRPLDLSTVRLRAAERRRNRQVVAALAVVLVLVGGVIGLPRVLGGGAAESAGTSAEGGAAAEAGPAENQANEQARAAPPPAVDPAPDGWRTEYYRDISFEVPQDWGYAVPPDPAAWCAGDGASGQLRPEQRSPYVWLRPESMAQPSIACGPMPDSLLSEHVVALEPGALEDFAGEPMRSGDWWLVGRYVGSAYLVVTTKDRELGDRIVASARRADAAAPCAPTSPASELGARPEPAHELARLGRPDAAVVCQYEASTLGTDPEPRLRAATRLDGSAAATLAAALGQGRPNVAGCGTLPADGRPELSIQVDFVVEGRIRTVYVSARGCPDGPGMSGGVDDGTTLRLLAREGCRGLLAPPVDLFAGSGDVGRACVR